MLEDKPNNDPATRYAWEPLKLRDLGQEILGIATEGIYMARTGVDYLGRPMREADRLVAHAAQSATLFEALRGRESLAFDDANLDLLGKVMKGFAKRSM